MNHLKSSIAIIAIGSLLFAVGCDNRNETTTPTNRDLNTDRSSTVPTQRDADNTARNRGDGATQNLTPIAQSQSMEHIRLTADIRRAVLDDDRMSMNAQNCKIITSKDGVVTLRGVVNSTAERDAVEAHAARIAGEANVVNQLEVNYD
ncbi:MAG: BON domain-containing protein [Phycisphaeraceae bacterium]|nr:MAG: BON domain-containing protein [Phycisphaeraceae bacterium]